LNALALYEWKLADFKRRGGISSVLGGSITAIEHRAGGGPVVQGTPYMVGENGPELFVAPQSGSILPLTGGGGQSAGGWAAPGGMTVNVTVQGFVGGEDEVGRVIIRQIEAAQRRGMRSPVLVNS
jgi:hypothetical protein